MKVSVITPTYNPRKDYLHRVFAGLAAQKLSKDQWEYLVVDSGSEPPLREQLDVSWHPNGKILEAPFKTLAKSRFKGLQEAKGELAVFVDDDNVLEPAFLEKAIAMMEKYPFIGVLGPYVEGEFEVPYEEWMIDFLPMLSCMQWSPERKLPIQYALSIKCAAVVPPGNGMIIRRAVVDAYIDRINRDSSWLEIGRVGDALIGSEDYDLAVTARDIGMALGTTSEIKMKHLIPARRLELGYLRRLLYASNYGTARVQIKRGLKEPQKPGPDSPHWKKKVRTLWCRVKPPSPEEQCWAALAKGHRDGITGQPFDEEYK